MAVARQTMTDEQRKSDALEYLKAFDNGGVTYAGMDTDRYEWLSAGGRDPSNPLG